MAMEITGAYNSYGPQNATEDRTAKNTKNAETEKAAKEAGNSKTKSRTDYARELAKLVPSVDFKIGTGLSTAKSGMTLTINPQLLEKMQNDPAQEKETKELIKGVESAMNLIESLNRASGWTVVYKHSYIDENGKYHSVGYYRNDFMLNMSDKLREERRKNSEKLLERQKESAAEKEEKLLENLEKEQEEKAEKKSTENVEESPSYQKAKQLLEEKRASSKDGKIYLNDEEFQTILDAAKEENEDKNSAKKPAQIGANLDIKI